MKKLVLILIFLVSYIGISQVKPASHNTGVRIGDPSGTTADPTDLETPVGFATFYWNASLSKFRYWNGNQWNDLGNNNIGDQDNIYRDFQLTAVDFQMQSLVDAINNSASFTIGEKDIAFFKIGSTANPSQGFIIATLKDLGKGNYGQGGQVITSSNLNILSVLPLTITDIENLASTQVIELGDIGLLSIEDGFNAHTFTGIEDPIQTQDNGYVLVNAVQNSLSTQYLFVGLGGDYGTTGNLLSINEEFSLLDEEYVIDDVWRTRDGTNKAYRYDEWLRHKGNANFSGDIFIGGVIRGADRFALGKVQIGGDGGADFIGGNTNHSVYRFNQPAPTGNFTVFKEFNNVIIGRDFSFVNGATQVGTKSLEISPSIDFSNISDAVNSAHKSISIEPNLVDLNGARNFAIHSVIGDMYFGNGDLFLPDITTGIAVNGLGQDAEGKVIPIALGGGGTGGGIYSGSGTLTSNPTIVDIQTGQLEFTGSYNQNSVVISNTGNGRSLYVNSTVNDPFHAQIMGTTNRPAIQAEKIHDSNNNIQSVLEIRRNTSNGSNGTIGMGGEIEYMLEQDAGQTQKVGGLSYEWVDSTSGSGDSKFNLTTQENNIIRNVFEINNLGQPKFNFLGQGNFTGTETYNAVWDANGNLIEAPLNSGGGTDDQTASEVTSDDATYDVVTGTTVQANLVDIDNLLFKAEPENIADASTLIINKTGGRNYNVGNSDTVNSNASFLIDSDIVTNGWARVKINRASQPTFPVGVNQEGGMSFQANTDMYMIVWSKGTTVNDVVYYFAPIATSPTSGFNTRFSATISGNTNMDWSVADTFVYTLSGATTIVDTGLPTGTATKVITMIVTGDETLTLPNTWTPLPSNDVYDGTTSCRINVECINGNNGSEIIHYSLTNL